MNPITFCNKKCLEITSNLIKNNIKNIILNYNNKNTNDFLLLLTTYNNKKYCIFINKKTKQLIYIRFCFKASLFSNTLFEGKLIKNIFYINDILLYKNSRVCDQMSTFLHNTLLDPFSKVGSSTLSNEVPPLNEKETLINNIMKSEYKHDPILNVCKIFFNRIQINKECINKKVNGETLLKIDTKKKQEFVIYKTDIPDVFVLKQNDVECGNPLIQTIKTSKYVNALFKNKNDEIEIQIWCKYSDKFKKLKPIIPNLF
jgi:hypothetical protein